MSQNSKSNLIIGVIVVGVVLAAGVLIYVNKTSRSNGNEPQSSNIPSSRYDASTLETFAKCLTEKGLIFYGAWWCPHCNNQKALFGDAFRYVNYVECEKNPGQSKGQLTDACVRANIESYPTWIFADGARKTGEVPLETLSQLTNCELK